MSTSKREVQRDTDRLYTLTSKLAVINEQLKGTYRLDKRRLLKAKSKHVNIFLKIIWSREENISRSIKLINRYQYILRRKRPSLTSKLSSFLHKIAKPFTRVVFRFASFFSALSPPPSSFAKNWAFTEEELYLWSKRFSTELIGKVRVNMDQLRLKVKGYKEKWRKKSVKLLSKASMSLKKGRERAFKYVQ